MRGLIFKRRWIAVLVILFLLPMTWAMASVKHDAIEDVFKRIEKIQTYFMRKYLQPAMSLSSPQIDQMMAVIKKTNAKRQANARARLKLVDQIDAELKAGKDLSASLAEIQVLENEALAIERLKREELRTLISPEQEAKFLLWRRDIVRKVVDTLKPFL